MSGNYSREMNQEPVSTYQIMVEGHLAEAWSVHFEGLTITLTERGETVLTGPIVDQAALHGLLKKVRDLGIQLISVERLPVVHNDDLSHKG